MIVRMSKYEFILHAKECELFVDRLRELGMVDVTTTGWEPSERDRNLVLDIESTLKAQTMLQKFMQKPTYDSTAMGYSSGLEAYNQYQSLSGRLAEYNSQIMQLEKLRDEVWPWGEFAKESLSQLSDGGVELRYFISSESEFEKLVEKQGSEHIILEVNQVDGRVYFVVVVDRDSANELNVNADSVKSLTTSASDAAKDIERIKRLKSGLDGELSHVANSLPLIMSYRAELLERLQLSRVSASSQQEAEGSLLVMEAWAESETSATVDELLDAQEGLIYFKSDPTPEDNTPVKLKNGWYAELFEMVTKLYALPKYGTIDLTPYFAPFYMLFFAICLCDAGYGAIILAAGIGLYLKGGEGMRKISKLSMFCGGTISFRQVY